MSVSNPVGSGGGLVAFDRDLQGMAEQMNTVGGWAEIMAQDSLNNTVDEEETREECADPSFQENRSSEPPSYPKSTEEPPYSVQVTNVPANCNPDDLYLFFGGDDKIVDMQIRADAARATIEFKDPEYLEEVRQKSKELKLVFEGKPLKIFRIQTNRIEAQRNRDREDRGSVSSRQGGNFQQPRDNFSRQSSRYNSQSSLTSDVRNDTGIHRNEYGRPDYSRQQDHYGTMPPLGGRGYNNEFRGAFRGGYRGGRGGPRGPYDNNRRGYYQGDIQRSESYTFDNERPAPINRSRTDSVNMNRRQSDMNSRTSSQFSLNQDDSRPPQPAVKKPTSKDIFGEAKPVDTETKLKELEAKMENKKKEEKERAEKERQQQQQAMAASHPPPHHPQHFQHPQGYNRHAPPPHFQQYHPHPQMQYYPQPVYATPMVPQYPHTHHSPMYHEQPPHGFDGGVGTVKIIKRSEDERDSASVGNMSPPLDPEHEPKEPVRSPVKEHPANQSQSSEAVKSDSSHSRGGKYNRGDRTFFNSSHKSSSYEQQGGRGSYRGGRGRGGGSRGGGYSGPRSDSHPVADAGGENNNNKENTATPVQDTPLTKEKEHHGSHASLKSRGQTRPTRGGTRGRSFKEKGPRNRDDRTAGKGGEKAEKEPRPVAKKEEEKPKAPVAKVEVKETPVKAQEAVEASTPASDAKEKKSKKKKNASKAQTSVMNGNKFAALANADE